MDDRVGSRDLAAPLRKAGLDVEVVRLDFADVAFVGRGQQGAPLNIGVELKRLSDLVSSLRTGRLAGHQVPGLLAQYDYRWLVIEGQYGVDTLGQPTIMRKGGPQRLHGRMTLDELEGRLLTLELEAGLHLRHTQARWQTIRFLARLYRWWTDVDREDHRSHLIAHTAPAIVPLSPFRRVLGQVAGVGPKVSRAAEQQFGTIARAVTATVDDWAGLKVGDRRLGRKVATTIVQCCQGEP